MQRFLILAVLLLAIVAASCGGGKGGSAKGTPQAAHNYNPIPGNSELVVGPNRFAFGLIDPTNHPVLEAAGTSVHMQFLLGTHVEYEADAQFTWAIPDVTGFWTVQVTFDQAGDWIAQAIVTQNGETSPVKFYFTVTQTGIVPNVGDHAPATDNLTLVSEPNIKRVTTDPEPDTALYEMTVAQALDAGKPFVVVFATPAFCQTRFCGPVLDNVKAVRQQFAEQVNFIHIEPYDLTDEGALVTDADNLPVPAQPTNDWRLQSEPWVFIVGADGLIRQRFEGAASPAELSQAIEAALS